MIIWDCFFDIAKDNINLNKILHSLLNLFSLKYSSSSKKKRKFILYSSIYFITNKFDFSTNIINDKNLLKNIINNIDIFYKQIKSNEIKPNTDYLYKDISKTNQDKSIEKLKTLDDFLNK